MRLIELDKEFPKSTIVAIVFGFLDTTGKNNFQDYELLCGVRSKNSQHAPLKLCVPGGYLDAANEDNPGEGVTETAQREFKEETGLDFSTTQFKMFFEKPRVVDNKQTTTFAFVTKLLPHHKRVAKATDDLQEIKWIRLSQLITNAGDNIKSHVPAIMAIKEDWLKLHLNILPFAWQAYNKEFLQ